MHRTVHVPMILRAPAPASPWHAGPLCSAKMCAGRRGTSRRLADREPLSYHFPCFRHRQRLPLPIFASGTRRGLMACLRPPRLGAVAPPMPTSAPPRAPTDTADDSPNGTKERVKSGVYMDVQQPVRGGAIQPQPAIRSFAAPSRQSVRLQPPFSAAMWAPLARLSSVVDCRCATPSYQTGHAFNIPIRRFVPIAGRQR